MNPGKLRTKLVVAKVKSIKTLNLNDKVQKQKQTQQKNMILDIFRYRRT